MNKRNGAGILGVLLAIGGLGCPEAEVGLEAGIEAAGSAGGGESGPTWHGEVREIVETHCVDCHQAGAIAPFALEEHAEVKAMAVAALAAIESGAMPPWMPDPECRHFVGERIMTAEEKATFAQWVEDGAPLGVPSDVEEEVAPEVDFPVTDVAIPLDPYVPDGELTDDYRCLPLDITFDEDVFLTASRVVPGSLSLVHHVLIFGVQPSASDKLDAADAADPGPGYSCFAGTEVSTPFPIGAWVPGIEPIVMDAGKAIHIPAGRRIVMQVHYNLLSAEPVADLTRWEVRLTTEEPEQLVVSRPFLHRTFLIPKDEANSVHSREFINKTEDTWEILSVAPHMHLLGTRLVVEKLDSEGADECLIDIPRWDFNWQQNFDFLPDETVQVAPGEGLRLTCEFDNSQANQPVVDGAQVERGDVPWGDGALDEMCLVFITTSREFDGLVPMCDGFNQCISTCDEEDSFECIVKCMAEDVDCAWCLIPEIFAEGGCVDAHCTAEMEAVDDCFVQCAVGGMAGGADVVGCMDEACPAELADIIECSNPILTEGSCDSAMYACNVFL